VTQSLIEYIVTELEKSGISASDIIVSRNNKINNFPGKNTFTISSEGSSLIPIKDDFLKNVINGIIKKVNYKIMQQVISEILLAAQYPKEGLFDAASYILHENNFLTLEQRINKQRGNSRATGIKKFLTENDTENIDEIISLVYMLQGMGDWDLEYTNQMLSNLNKSFEKDAPFVLSILGLDYFKLDNISTESKSMFKKEIESLIENYSAKNDKDKDFKQY